MDVKNASDDYKYPHSFDHHWIEQQYLPEEVDFQGYQPGEIGREHKLWKRIEEIKKAK
jgi:putative ATPase